MLYHYLVEYTFLHHCNFGISHFTSLYIAQHFLTFFCDCTMVCQVVVLAAVQFKRLIAQYIRDYYL